MWAQHTTVPTNTVYRIVARRYTKAQGWGEVTELGGGSSRGTGSNSAYFVRPEIAVNAQGDTFVAWADNSRSSLLSSIGAQLIVKRFTVAAGWESTASLVDAPIEAANSEPKIAVSDNGSALLVWEAKQRLVANGPLVATVKMRAFAPATGWGVPGVVPNSLFVSTEYVADLAQIKMDAQGNALMVWMQRDASLRFVGDFASRYTPAGGWSAAAALPRGGGRIPQLFVNADGTAKFVWAQDNRNLGQNQIQSVSYSPAAGWSTAITNVTTNVVFPGSPYPADFPDLSSFAIDGAGNVAVVSNLQRAPIVNLWALQYSATQGGWVPSTQLKAANPNGFSGSSPTIRFDSNGNATAVWSESDGAVQNIWAARLD